MASQKKNNDDKSRQSSKHGDDVSAADYAKNHLRNDKDLNRAYPLDEKNPSPIQPRKGT